MSSASGIASWIQIFWKVSKQWSPCRRSSARDDSQSLVVSRAWRHHAPCHSAIPSSDLFESCNIRTNTHDRSPSATMTILTAETRIGTALPPTAYLPDHRSVANRSFLNPLTPHRPVPTIFRILYSEPRIRESRLLPKEHRDTAALTQPHRLF